jgi:hypothetical protein
MWWKKYVGDTEKTTCWSSGPPSSILYEASVTEGGIDVSIKKKVFHHMLTSVLDEMDRKISIQSLEIILCLGEHFSDESVRVELMELICRIYATFPSRVQLILGFSNIVLNLTVNPKGHQLPLHVVNDLRHTLMELFTCLFLEYPYYGPLIRAIYDFSFYVKKVSLTTLQNLCIVVTFRKQHGMIFKNLQSICLSLMNNENPFHMYCQPFDEDFPVFQELISSKMKQGRCMRILLNMMIGKNRPGFFTLKKFPVEMFRELKRFLF